MEELRKCRVCGEEKPLTEYNSAGIKNGKHYRRRKCRKCYSHVKKKYRDDKLKWFRDYKETLACEGCGYSKDTNSKFSIQAMQFHHHNNDKLFNVSEGVYFGYSKEKIIDEINKCMVLCSRCHAEKHTK